MKILPVFLFALLPLAAMADTVVPIEAVENSVNIRSEPSATAEVIGRLKQGDSLLLVTSQEGWNEVQLEEGETGFISADWTLVRAGPMVDVMAEEVVEEVAETATVEVAEEVAEEAAVEVAVEVAAETAEEVILTETVVMGPPGRPGPPGPPGPPGDGDIKGSENYLVKFRKETVGRNSQIYDDGNRVGIGTTEPAQRLEVNGSIQIHDQNSNVAGLMITQSDGDTGYVMHNRAGTLTIGAASQDRITIDRDGNVGIAVARPEHPLEMASGAHVTTGGVWTNRSSRSSKENIVALSDTEAAETLMGLEPVTFNYVNEREEGYVGFIAEDVPGLVASGDRESLSTMDIVAVLTKVVQAQQRKLEELEARLDVR
jgi:hypothetical protein